ncbi:YlbD family protein [Shouchella lonarensis]|uniref:Coat protein n=1 Tax=Shouchella lonarensis TaxID=1464122 RepID=A0A1G6KTZ5_9BACI|nr:YlbD family protein [Shouchella lonarensis]SDC34251.1 Putative coat protein [Shouchella lonarensis]
MDAQDNLHPSVQAFKSFIKAHPGVMRDIQSGKKTMQNVFEEWTILGEGHEYWQSYRQTEGEYAQTDAPEEPEQPEAEGAEEDEEGADNGEMMGQLLGMMKKMNVQDLQSHLAQFSAVLGNIQNLVQTFQKPTAPTARKENDSPFSFRKD